MNEQMDSLKNLSGQNKKPKEEKKLTDEEVKLNNIVKEFDEKDAQFVFEEFKILVRAEIPNLKSKIGSFRLVKDLSPEMQELAKEGKLPAILKGKIGEQNELDQLLEELSNRKKDLEDLKRFLLNKDIDSIRAFRKKREERYDKKFGAYYLSGKEYNERENSFNFKLELERLLKGLSGSN